MSSFTKKNVLVDAGLNLLNKNNFGNNSNQNFRSPNNQKKNGSKYNSFFNNNNIGEESGVSRLENEVQKKVKTILKKDFIGRYKRSPYLKIFNE